VHRNAWSGAEAVADRRRNDAIVERLVQSERAGDLERGHGGRRELGLHVLRQEVEAVVARRFDVHLRKEINRCIEDAASEQVAEGR
jgi:hypothetical protein